MINLNKKERCSWVVKINQNCSYDANLIVFCKKKILCFLFNIKLDADDIWWLKTDSWRVGTPYAHLKFVWGKRSVINQDTKNYKKKKPFFVENQISDKKNHSTTFSYLVLLSSYLQNKLFQTTKFKKFFSPYTGSASNMNDKQGSSMNCQ